MTLQEMQGSKFLTVRAFARTNYDPKIKRIQRTKVKGLKKITSSPKQKNNESDEDKKEKK